MLNFDSDIDANADIKWEQIFTSHTPRVVNITEKLVKPSFNNNFEQKIAYPGVN